MAKSEKRVDPARLARVFRNARPPAPKRPAASPVGEAVGWVLKRLELDRATPRRRVAEAWQRLLGSDARYTELVGLKANVATFTVDSSALLSELNNFRKQELLEGLRAEVKTYFVRDIRFRLQKRRPGPATDRRKR